VTGTLAVDGRAVTFGTAMRGLGRLRPPRPVPSSPYQMKEPTHHGQCTNFILCNVAL